MKTVNKWLLTMIFGIAQLSLSAQENVAEKYAKYIDRSELEKHLSVLAHDSLEGRNTGEKGQKMAADYIRSYFTELGLQPVVETADGKSYFQSLDLYKAKKGDAYLKVGKEKINDYDGILYWGSGNFEKETKADVVYVPAMSDSALALVDVKGKIAAVPLEGRFTQFLPKVEEAGAKGALVIVSDSSYMSYIMNIGKRMADNPRLSRNAPEESNFGTFIIDDQLAKTILKELKSGAKGKVSFSAKMSYEVLPSENVLGYLEGSDKKDELLIITGHYDHLGMDADGNVFNGADDDASGTSAVMAMAKAFVEAKKAGNGPRRSILFMPVTGEEKGLLGSGHYADNPVFPLENTIANLNLDMIGRTDSLERAEKNYIYIVGSDRLSTELHEINESKNETFTKMYLDYTYNSESHPMNIYYRSDHWNFAKNGIPVIFYFDGIHADYHKITDTIEKIEWELFENRTHLVFHTAWELVNKEERIEADLK